MGILIKATRGVLSNRKFSLEWQQSHRTWNWSIFIISLLNCVPALAAVVADHGPLYALPVVAPELAHLAAIRVP